MFFGIFSSPTSQKALKKTQKLLVGFFVVGFSFFGGQLEPVFAEFNSMLAPTDYTPSSYIPPNYDAFDHDYYRPPVYDEVPNTPPEADFTIYNDQNGLQSQARGTTSTRFTFDASNSSDNETDISDLEVRWDFENDGVLDSYFSRTKTIEHTFKTAGVYTVKLQVLDPAGNISSTTHTVTVANNTPPEAYFVVEPTSGTEQTIFHFDTSRSRDDQYMPYSLVYRFDWNGDGTWDTSYQDKTDWNHRFNTSGTFKVIMEAKDPEGATGQYSAVVSTAPNTPPFANFSLQAIPNSQGVGYEFNASSSTDAETAHNNLLYRWDFNYNGPDDIVYDTDWSSSDRYSGYYSIPGTKVIKLEVKDEDGAISRAYAQINVSWTETMAKQLMTGLR